MELNIFINGLFYLVVGCLYLFHKDLGKHFYMIVGIVYVLFSYIYLEINKYKLKKLKKLNI
jgi:hypothetical protein